MSQPAAAQIWTMVYWLWATAVTVERTTGWSRTGKHLNLSLISQIMDCRHANAQSTVETESRGAVITDSSKDESYS